MSKITNKIIALALRADPCREGLRWALERPRTIKQLVEHNRAWAEWLALRVPDLPDAVANELYKLAGARAWWKHGKWHREDGPAVERPNGTTQWWRNGNLHRDDGPAVQSADGTIEWWRNGLLHRTDGPAIEWADGTREWWKNGKFIRKSDPARQHRRKRG